MSRHWRPGGRSDWTVIEGYGAAPKARGGVVLLVLLAVFLGLAGGAAWQRWNAPIAEASPSGPIEWNEVQAVPKPAPRPEDQEWEKRGQEQGPSTRTRQGIPEGTTVAGQHIFVIDGDTFDLNGTRIRVAGIDAPETHPSRCANEAALGAAATQKLAELLRGGTLWMSGETTDRYGRSVRTVRVNGEDVADAMIGSGLARNYDGKHRQGWC